VTDVRPKIDAVVLTVFFYGLCCIYNITVNFRLLFHPHSREKIMNITTLVPVWGLQRKLATAVTTLAFALSAPVPVMAQEASAPAQGSASRRLPDVPTTRMLAIGRLTPGTTPRELGAVLPEEVRDTVKLYLSGKIDQWYVRKDQTGVVFILNITDADEARRTLAQLPLGRAKLMEFDLIPLGPLSPLAALGAKQTAGK
jgi:hypothetical protein